MSLISWFTNLRKPKMPLTSRRVPFIPPNGVKLLTVTRNDDFVTATSKHGLLHYMLFEGKDWVRITPVDNCHPLYPETGDMFYCKIRDSFSMLLWYYLYTREEDGWDLGRRCTDIDTLQVVIEQNKQERARVVQSKLNPPARPYNNKGAKLHLVQNMGKFIKAKDPETNAIRWFLDENRELASKPIINHDEFDHPEIFPPPNTNLFSPKGGDFYYFEEGDNFLNKVALFSDGEWMESMEFVYGSNKLVVDKYSDDFVKTVAPDAYFYRHGKNEYQRIVVPKDVDPFNPKDSDLVLLDDGSGCFCVGLSYNALASSADSDKAAGEWCECRCSDAVVNEVLNNSTTKESKVVENKEGNAKFVVVDVSQIEEVKRSKNSFYELVDGRFFFELAYQKLIQIEPQAGCDPLNPKTGDVFVYRDTAGTPKKAKFANSGVWEHMFEADDPSPQPTPQSSVYNTPDGKQHIYLGGEWYTNDDKTIDYANPVHGHLIFASGKPTWLFDGKQWTKISYCKEIDATTLRNLQDRSREAADSMPEFARLLNEFFNKV